MWAEHRVQGTKFQVVANHVRDHRGVRLVCTLQDQGIQHVQTSFICWKDRVGIASVVWIKSAGPHRSHIGDVLM